MKMLRVILAFVLPLLVLVGCRDRSGLSAEEQAFLDAADYGVYSGGKALFTIGTTAGECQFVSNGVGSFTRLQTDGQDRYIHMQRLSGPERPETGAIVVVEVSVRGLEGVASGRVDMTVKKLKGDYLWLWNDEKQLGVIILP